MEHSDNATSSSKRFTGRVKWFNNKSGYGFITATVGDITGADIFVHYSAINVDHQYKYLVQGEYVEFALNEITDGSHPHQAGSVTGINNGLLMCETRREIRVTRNKGKVDDVDDEAQPKRTESKGGKRSVKAKVRGSGPREDTKSDTDAVPMTVVDGTSAEEIVSAK